MEVAEGAETDEQKDSKNFAQLRTRAEKAEARAFALETTVKAQAVKLAGFDPEDGVTKLVIEKWTPEDAADFTADGFKAHAETIGLKAPAAATDATDATTDANAQQLDQLQAQGDALRQASTQQTPVPTIEQKIAEAEAKGDWDTAGSLKTQRLLDKSGIKV